MSEYKDINPKYLNCLNIKKPNEASDAMKDANMKCISIKADVTNIKGLKPFGVLFDDTQMLICANHWTDLIAKVTKYVIDTFASDGGKRLKESKLHDYYGKTYFFEDVLISQDYTYVSDYNLSVYKCGGAVVTLAMVNEICKLYTINPDRVWLLLVV
jgi:hypothetical protein